MRYVSIKFAEEIFNLKGLKNEFCLPGLFNFCLCQRKRVIMFRGKKSIVDLYRKIVLFRFEFFKETYHFLFLRLNRMAFNT